MQCNNKLKPLWFSLSNYQPFLPFRNILLLDNSLLHLYFLSKQCPWRTLSNYSSSNKQQCKKAEYQSYPALDSGSHHGGHGGRGKNSGSSGGGGHTNVQIQHQSTVETVMAAPSPNVTIDGARFTDLLVDPIGEIRRNYGTNPFPAAKETLLISQSVLYFLHI